VGALLEREGVTKLGEEKFQEKLKLATIDAIKLRINGRDINPPFNAVIDLYQERVKF
jgi:hypothetical protein